MSALLASRWARSGALALLAAAVLALPAAVDDRYLLKVLTFVAFNVIVVAGFSLLFGYAGQVSLGHAAFVGIGAYASGYAATAWGWPPALAIAFAVAVSGAGGLLLALPSLRLKGHYLAMATLGFSVIMSIAFVEAKGITGGNDGLSKIPYASIGPWVADTPQANYLVAWVVAMAVLLLVAGITSRRPGRAMSALHGSENGALASGVDPVGVKTSVFTLSAALAGLSGALYAHALGYISPSSFSLEVSIILLAMVVLGGSRSLAGPVCAAALLTLIPYVDAIVPGLPAPAIQFLQDWEADIYGIVIIGVMLFAPGGIASALRAVSRRLTPPRTPASGDLADARPGEVS